MRSFIHSDNDLRDILTFNAHDGSVYAYFILFFKSKVSLIRGQVEEDDLGFVCNKINQILSNV